MKYFRIMELECSTPINNKSVGADFYTITELEKDSIIKEIEKRENNFEVDEITEDIYNEETEHNNKRNFRLMTGY